MEGEIDGNVKTWPVFEMCIAYDSNCNLVKKSPCFGPNSSTEKTPAKSI